MAASITQTLIDKDFRNWLKGALAALFARQGIIDFVEHEITDFQNDLLNDVYKVIGIPAGTTCNSCTTTNVLVCPTPGFCTKGKKCNVHDSKISTLKPNQPCPLALCTALRDAIRNEHRYKGPSWKNTDARRWCSDAYQLAKCYMPPDGYSDKASYAETDFNGVIAVIINNKLFEKKLSTNFSNKSNICEEARKACREIRHSATHQLSDNDLVTYIDVFIQLLSDPVYLVNDAKAKEAVDKLNQLKRNALTIHADDITSILNDTIKATFDDQQNELLHKIQEHFNAHKRDSVEAIDKMVQEFVQLKVQSIIEIQIQTEQRKCELYSEIEKGKGELSAQIEKGMDELNAQTKKSKDELIVQTTKGKDELISLIEMGQNEVEAKTKEGTEVIEARYKQLLEELNRSAELKYIANNDDSLLQEFRAELVLFYSLTESMIPASPLVEDHAVPLTELYVQPPMFAFIKPVAFGRENKPSKKTPVSSYRELFLNEDNVPFKNIYVEANAGYGKTFFTQMVAMTWCQAHNPIKIMKSKFRLKDVDTLKRFDFLFLLHLRDFQDDSCNLDNLILKFVSQNLPRKEQFSEQFVARLLHTKTCLAIIDGLDEWVHPESCILTPGIPHNNYLRNCTVLTTTRPWKLSAIGLPPDLIDRHLEISELDEESSEELKSNAVTILCKMRGKLQPDLNDFDRKLESVKLGDICLIPYILLNKLFVWFEGQSIGKSKCETYSNTIEFILERGLQMKNEPTPPTLNEECNVTGPECMRHNTLCKRYVKILLKLGKLVFNTLFQGIQESSLVIEHSTVLNFLTRQELEFCLKIGLLTKTSDSSKVAVKRYKVLFQHRYVQQFIAALYITSEWQNYENIKLTIAHVCSSLSSILEMSDLFVFVCGMNPEVYTCISSELLKIVDRDGVTLQYRTDMHNDQNVRETIQSYQSMQLQCLQESVRNGNESFPIPVCFLLAKHSLTHDLTALKSIMQFNKLSVISLQVSLDEKIVAALLPQYPVEFMQLMDHRVLTSLETLRVDENYQQPAWLFDVLTESARELKCLTISQYRYYQFESTLTALTGLTCLQSLALDHVDMTHSNLICLFAYISQTTTITQLKLELIHCSDVWHHYCDVTLDLYRLPKLEMLHIDRVLCRELHINPVCLEKLEFQPPMGEKLTASASALLWKDLRGASVLSTLMLYRMSFCQEMIQTIPLLTQLQYLKLKGIDMGGVFLGLSPAMIKLERLELECVAMKSAAWRALLRSVGQLTRSITVKLSEITMTSQEWRELLLNIDGPVKMELYWCNGPSDEEWKNIVDAIKLTPTLSLIQDLSFPASMTMTNKSAQ